MKKIFCAEALLSAHTFQDLDHAHYFSSRIAAMQSFEKTWESFSPLKFEPLSGRDGWLVTAPILGARRMIGRIEIMEIPETIQEMPINLESIP